MLLIVSYKIYIINSGEEIRNAYTALDECTLNPYSSASGYLGKTR
jgi:hypothetical protein